MNLKSILIISALAFGVACSSGAEENNNNKPPIDMSADVQTTKDVDGMEDEGTADVPDMSKDAADGGDMPDVECQKKTACDGACGMVDDGCGGVLECDPCACNNGIPVEPTCGLCDLGKTVCVSDTETTCEEKVIPNLAGASCAGDVRYYSDVPGNTGSGTRDNPFRGNFQKALDDAFAAGAGVLIVGGNPVVTETIIIQGGTTTVAGFGVEPEWVPTSENRIKVNVPVDGGGKSIGLILKDTADTTSFMRNVDITTADATKGNSSYGVLLVNAKELTLEKCSITAGKGSVGEAGGVGADGGPGTPGKKPADARTDRDKSPFFPNYGEVSQLDYDAGANTGQVTTLNCSVGKTRGGKGGSGVFLDMIFSSGSGYSPDFIAPLIHATGGGDSPTSGAPGASLARLDTNTVGNDGGAGLDGAQVGNVGTPSSNSGSLTAQGLWSNSSGKGGSGAPGMSGTGGGGGSGSGAFLAFTNDDAYSGAHGGGGGSGGCFGEGGTGGKAGGGSFGIVALNSKVSLVDTTVAAGSGGTGGKGGDGGKGGSGGVGGDGSDNVCLGKSGAGSNCFPATYTMLVQSMTPGSGSAYKGGKGGDGGDGTDGGQGAGGAGGPSYGLFCSGTSSVFKENAMISVGTAGAGGAPNGKASEAVEEKGCE